MSHTVCEGGRKGGLVGPERGQSARSPRAGGADWLWTQRTTEGNAWREKPREDSGAARGLSLGSWREATETGGQGWGGRARKARGRGRAAGAGLGRVSGWPCGPRGRCRAGWRVLLVSGGMCVSGWSPPQGWIKSLLSDRLKVPRAPKLAQKVGVNASPLSPQEQASGRDKGDLPR